MAKNENVNPEVLENLDEDKAPATFFEEIPAKVAPPKGIKGVNLRQGPGTQFGVLQVLAAGCEAGVLGLPFGAEVPGWALVAAEDGGVGWVDCRYIQPVEG